VGGDITRSLARQAFQAALLGLLEREKLESGGLDVPTQTFIAFMEPHARN
jgi:hypothetical protein